MSDETTLFDPSTGEVLFGHAELACKATGVVRLGDGFAEALLLLRRRFGQPMRVTSCCRSAAHNRTVGGHPRSLHVYDAAMHAGQTGTLAIDIAVDDAAQACRLGEMALDMGWSVGVPKAGFIHLDRRRSLGLPKGLFGY